jgi:hypothetical protein
MRWNPSTPRGRHLSVICFVALVASSVGVHAAETLKTTTGRHYANVRILQVDPNGIMIRHKDGMAKVLFDDLSKTDRQKYRYNEENAKAFVAERRQGAAEAPAGETSGGEAPATNVNVNLRINVAATRAQPVGVWRIPYPYYRYPKSRALWSNDYRPLVYRPYYPYNTYSYLRKQFSRSRVSLACGHPFFMLGGALPGPTPADCILHDMWHWNSHRAMLLQSQLMHLQHPGVYSWGRSWARPQFY